MKNTIKKFLFDINESIDSIENYIGDKKDFNIYQSNKMLRRAVEREFEIRRSNEQSSSFSLTVQTISIIISIVIYIKRMLLCN